MSLAENAIVAGGVLSLLFAIGHTGFYRLFGWREEFERMHPRNRKVLYTIHVALYLLFLPGAYASIRYPDQLARAQGLGGALALSYAAFWCWRLVWQIAYFGPQVRRASPGWRRFHHALVVALAVETAAYAGPVAAAWLAA